MAIYIFLACFNGMIVAFSRLINAALGTYVGSMQGSMINHFVGSLFAGLIMVLGFSMGHLHFEGVPTYLFFGGCLGVLVVTANNFAVPYIGAMVMTIIMVTCQILTSALIDHIGLLNSTPQPLSGWRILGIFLLISGAGLVIVKRK